MISFALKSLCRVIASSMKTNDVNVQMGEIWLPGQQGSHAAQRGEDSSKEKRHRPRQTRVGLAPQPADEKRNSLECKAHQQGQRKHPGQPHRNLAIRRAHPAAEPIRDVHANKHRQGEGEGVQQERRGPGLQKQRHGQPVGHMSRPPVLDGTGQQPEHQHGMAQHGIAQQVKRTHRHLL